MRRASTLLLLVTMPDVLTKPNSHAARACFIQSIINSVCLCWTHCHVCGNFFARWGRFSPGRRCDGGQWSCNWPLQKTVVRWLFLGLMVTDLCRADVCSSKSCACCLADLSSRAFRGHIVSNLLDFNQEGAAACFWFYHNIGTRRRQTSYQETGISPPWRWQV